LDFGLAKSQAPLPAASNLTIPGMILGTMQYMAPEQFDGVEADRRTDIFAFGVVVHEMITGKKAFEGKSQVMLISAIATSVPQPGRAGHGGRGRRRAGGAGLAVLQGSCRTRGSPLPHPAQPERRARGAQPVGGYKWPQLVQWN